MKYNNKRKIVRAKNALRAIKKMAIKLASALFVALQFILHYTEYFLQSVIQERTKKHGYLMSPRKVLGYFNKGIRFGDVALSQANSFVHALIFGVSGSGKSSQIFWNNFLIKRNASLIIRDVAGDFVKAAGWLKSIGYKIVIINLKNAHLSTDGINILKGNLSQSDIARIAKTIVGTVYKKAEYWSLSAEEYCAIFISLLKEQASEFHNLFNLKFLIESYIADEQSLDYLIAKSDNEDLVNAYMAMSATPEKTKLGSMATLKSTLARIDENIALATFKSTFDWQQLRKEKTVVYIQSSVLDDSYLNMVQSLLFTDVLKSLMEHGLPKLKELPVYIFLDECSSLSIGDMLQTCFLNLRKYAVSLCCAFQSPQSIDSTYSKEISEVIQANAFSKLYLPGMDLQTATYLEKYMGMKEVEDKERKTKHKEPVMTAFEIRTMKKKSVLLTGNNPATLVKLRPYYKIWRMKKRLAIKAPEQTSLMEKLGLETGAELPKLNIQMPSELKEQLNQK